MVLDIQVVLCADMLSSLIPMMFPFPSQLLSLSSTCFSIFSLNLSCVFTSLSLFLTLSLCPAPFRDPLSDFFL